MNASIAESKPPPSSPMSVYETHDLDDARHYMGGVFRSHRLRSVRAGALAMRHERVRIGKISAHWLRYGNGVTMSAPEMDHFYLFQFILRGRCEIAQGRDAAVVTGGHSYAVDPLRPLSKTWDADCGQLILRVERDHFDAFAARETGVETAGRLAFAFRPIPVASGQAGLFRLVEALREDAASREHTGGLSHVRVARHLEPTLMSLLLASFPHNLQDEYDRAAQPCTPYYVRRAEQYVRAHARDPLAMEELVRAAGVSARSLFGGFQRFRGTTPMAHLKAVRLDLARADLAAADPARASVTDIAIACGFTHMSKFARDFKARFGVTPRAMLRADGD
jgi:AraC-like DNA-binding protein